MAVIWRIDNRVAGPEPVKPAAVIHMRDDGFLYHG